MPGFTPREVALIALLTRYHRQGRPRTLRLTLIADEYPAVELWEAERNAASLMARAFSRRVVLESTAAPDAWVES